MTSPMIAWLLGWYVVSIAVACGGSAVAWRLSRRHPGHGSLRPFALFATFGFAHALLTFVGEVFAPLVAPGSAAIRGRIYLLVDFVTIPLVVAIFLSLVLWLRALLGRPISRRIWWLLAGLGAVFVLAFASPR